MKKLILVILFLIANSTAFSQNLSSGLDDWYLWTNDDARLFVAEAGQGDSVIVLHGGWGAEYSYLVPALEPLFDQYHITFYDQRGSLRSPAPDSTISLQRHVEDLEELRKEIGIDKVTLLSHSMGSFLAYAYLKRYPEHVKGIVLLSPVLPTGADYNKKKKKTAGKKFVEFAKANEKEELNEGGLSGDNLNDKEKTAKWRIAYASGNIYHIDRWEQMKGGQAFFNPDIANLINKNTSKNIMNNLFGTLQNATVPMYVIIGDHDLVDFGLTAWPNVAGEIPNMELLKLKDAGHNSWIDKPDKFIDAVEKALSQTTN